MATPKTSDDQGDYPYFGYFKNNADYWRNFITPEPISSDLQAKVRLDLQKQWYSDRLYMFRLFIHENWGRTSHGKTLESELGDLDSLREAMSCCNRPCGFYWSQDFQKAARSAKFQKTPTALFASIFSEWYKQYQNDPNIEFNHFIANPFEITERGPDTIRGILKSHVFMYEKAKDMLSKATQDEKSAICCSQERFENYKIHPLYPSLVLMVDRFELGPRIGEFRRPDRYINLQDVTHFQSVIIARTRLERQLSAPISFKSLCEKALPLERADFDGEADIDVIRVSLPEAVRFIVDLEKREDAATRGEIIQPEIDRSLGTSCATVFTSDRGFCDNRYEWADRHIIAAEKHGYEHCCHTARALRRVQAEMRNEIYEVLSPEWFQPRMIDYEGDLGPQI